MIGLGMTHLFDNSGQLSASSCVKITSRVSLLRFLANAFSHFLCKKRLAKLPFGNLPENQIFIMYILHNSLGFCNIFSRKSQYFLVHFSNRAKKCTRRRVCGRYSVRHFDDFPVFVWSSAPVPPSTTPRCWNT